MSNLLPEGPETLKGRLIRGNQDDLDYFRTLIEEKEFDMSKHPLVRKQTYLQCAVMSGNYELVKLILKEEQRRGIDINEPDYMFGTALVYATTEGHIEITKLLLDNGANPHYIDDINETPLFYVTKVEIIQLLLDEGLDINHVNNLGETPLAVLMSEYEDEYFEAVKFLLDHGARTDIVLPKWTAPEGTLTLHELVLSSYLDATVKNLFQLHP